MSVADRSYFAALSKLPEITVPKLTDDNYDIFNTALYFIIGRTIGINGIPVDYVMRGVTGNYDSPWTNWQDKLKNYFLRTGNSFKNDKINFYSLYCQYIGNKVVGSNIINKYHFTNNGRKCHQKFELHFWNDANLTNNATYATSTINRAVYNGDRRNFTLETYYTMMLKYFNDLSDLGYAHALNYTKKINAFEQG